jgi:hypothetical protein
MKYILIESDNTETFIKDVYNKISSGWKTHGKIFTYQKNDKVISSLTLTKEADISTKSSKEDKTVEEILASWNC